MSEILDTLTRRDSQIRGFSSRHEDLCTLLDSMVLSARMLQLAAARLPAQDIRHHMRVMCWSTAYGYQVSSLFLVLQKQVDAAFALCRMATELARDLARMSESEENYERWMNKSASRSNKDYRATFRFKDNDTLEQTVRHFYNVFSELGVHCHLASLMSLTKTGHTQDGQYVLLEITDEALLPSITLWCMAFFPIQNLCLRSFEPLLRRQEQDALRMFWDMANACMPLIQALSERDKKKIPPGSTAP